MPITPAEFERLMKELAEIGDPECRHMEADELMCHILIQYGYDAGVKIFTGMTKWYA